MKVYWAIFFSCGLGHKNTYICIGIYEYICFMYIYMWKLLLELWASWATHIKGMPVSVLLWERLKKLIYAARLCSMLWAGIILQMLYFVCALQVLLEIVSGIWTTNSMNDEPYVLPCMCRFTLECICMSCDSAYGEFPSSKPLAFSLWFLLFTIVSWAICFCLWLS